MWQKWMGPLGTVGGLAAGAALAPATGGASMLMPMMMGASAGGALGGGIGNAMTPPPPPPGTAPDALGGMKPPQAPTSTAALQDLMAKMQLKQNQPQGMRF